MGETNTSAPEPRSDLADLLRSKRASILEAWEVAVVRRLPRASRMLRPTLVDFVPRLLDRIIELVEAAQAGHASELPDEAAERHALDRLEEGFDLEEVILEVSLLRDTIIRLWEGAADTASNALTELRILNQALDRTMGASVVRYTEARDRVLRALDRIGSTVLEAENLDALLRRLIVSFREETAAVDTATILLREGDILSVRASMGLRGSGVPAISLRIGEGFAGRVAAERRPVQLRMPAEDRNVAHEIGHDTRLRVLYGLPLIDGGELLGVAHIGSCSADAFSEQDRVLFASMVRRATAGIYQHALREQVQQRARELERSERRFRATFESAAVGIAHVALDGTWLRLNKTYCEILGYPHDELLTLRFHDVTYPDDLQADLDHFQRLLAGEVDGYTMEKRYIRKDRGIVWVNLAVSLMRDASGMPEYAIAAVQDITPQIRLRERLGFLSSAGEMLAPTTDLRNTLEQVTQLAVPLVADWCGLDLTEEDDGLGDLVAVAHRDPSKAAFVRDLRRRYPPPPDAPAGPAKVIRTGEPELIREIEDAQMQQAAVDERHLELLRGLGLRSFLCVPLAVGGRVLGTLSLAMAESGRIFGEDDLALAQELARRASIAIENARLHDESDRAVRLRDRILAIVSHDLRNPIGTIELSSNVLLRNRTIADDPVAARRLEAIRRATGRASRLIEDLLDVSSIQAGKLTLERTRCELGPLLVESFETHEPVAQAKGIELHAALRVGHRSARCDRDRILQVLSNLIGNALKFCERGDRIDLAAIVDADEAVISVSDTGPGIAAEDLEHIFDVYWRGRRAAAGTGLGLFIAKGIVESHEGRIWAESRTGEGSTFFLTLPLLTAGQGGDDGG